MKKVLSCTVGLLFACFLSSSLVFLEDAVAVSHETEDLDVLYLLESCRQAIPDGLQEEQEIPSITPAYLEQFKDCSFELENSEPSFLDKIRPHCPGNPDGFFGVLTGNCMAGGPFWLIADDCSITWLWGIDSQGNPITGFYCRILF